MLVVCTLLATCSWNKWRTMSMQLTQKPISSTLQSTLAEYFQLIAPLIASMTCTRTVACLCKVNCDIPYALCSILQEESNPCTTQAAGQHPAAVHWTLNDCHMSKQHSENITCHVVEYAAPVLAQCHHLPTASLTIPAVIHNSGQPSGQTIIWTNVCKFNKHSTVVHRSSHVLGGAASHFNGLAATNKTPFCYFGFCYLGHPTWQGSAVPRIACSINQ